MTTSSRLLAVAALSVFTTNASFSFAQAPATTAPTTRVAEDVEEVRLSAGREDEYDALIADLKLEGDQLAAFKKADAQRIASLRAFVNGEEGQQLIALREQMAAARRTKNTAEVPILRDKIKPLSDRYWAVRNEGRRTVLATLTEPQIVRVAGGALYARVARNLPNTTPTPEQKTKTRELCDEAAAKWFKPAMLETDPFFREITPLEAPTRERVVAEVLTDEQRAAMLLPRARGTTRPTTRGASQP